MSWFKKVKDIREPTFRLKELLSNKDDWKIDTIRTDYDEMYRKDLDYTILCRKSYCEYYGNEVIFKLGYTTTSDEDNYLSDSLNSLYKYCKLLNEEAERKAIMEKLL